MYKIKKNVINKIKKEWGIVTKISKETELDRSYISQVLNGTRVVKKKVYAYAITKTISSNLEIEDIFEKF